MTLPRRRQPRRAGSTPPSPPSPRAGEAPPPRRGAEGELDPPVAVQEALRRGADPDDHARRGEGRRGRRGGEEPPGEQAPPPDSGPRRDDGPEARRSEPHSL